MMIMITTIITVITITRILGSVYKWVYKCTCCVYVISTTNDAVLLRCPNQPAPNSNPSAPPIRDLRSEVRDQGLQTGE